MLIGERLRAMREERNLSQGSPRKLDGTVAMLHFPGRKRSYRAEH